MPKLIILKHCFKILNLKLGYNECKKNWKNIPFVISKLIIVIKVKKSTYTLVAQSKFLKSETSQIEIHP